MHSIRVHTHTQESEAEEHNVISGCHAICCHGIRVDFTAKAVIDVFHVPHQKYFLSVSLSAPYTRNSLIRLKNVDDIRCSENSYFGLTFTILVIP